MKMLYQATTGTIVFAPGQTTATVSVVINGDRIAEQDETFIVRLTNPVNAALADAIGLGTIVDDEPRVRVGDARLVEGNRGVSYMTFSVRLSQAYDQSITVSFATQDGTATAGSDYQATIGTLTFAPGETTKTVRIVIYGDTSVELDEYFSLLLSDVSGNALIDDILATGWIANDDKAKGGGKKK
jgi:large repetitive protein